MPFWSASVLVVALAASPPASPHVRSANVRITNVIQRGDRLSPTLHRLLEALDASDVIVVFDTSPCDCSHAVSCISLVGSKGPVRYLRANVSLRQIDDRLIAQIAHEIQHAAEIAAVPGIRDEAALLRFYAARSEGCNDDTSCFETAEAVAVQKAVARELTSSN